MKILLKFSTVVLCLLASTLALAKNSEQVCQDGLKLSTIKGGYGKDISGGVYYDCQKIDKADVTTFRVFWNLTCTEGIDDCYGLARDKNYVYKSGKILPNIDPSFRYISKNGLAVDKNKLYCLNNTFSFNGGKKVTVKVLSNGSGYIKNDTELYILYDGLNCEAIKGIDVKSFKYNTSRKIFTDKTGLEGAFDVSKSTYTFKKKQSK